MQEYNHFKKTIMRELKHLRYLTASLIAQAIIGFGDSNTKIGQYRRIYIRLMDKSLREYGLARDAFLSDDSDVGRTFRFANHMETCINSLARLNKLRGRIKSEKNTLKLPDGIRKQVEKSSDAVRHIRNAIEHMDESIQKDSVKKGQAIIIVANETKDGFSIAKYKLGFEELATALEKMHELAVLILNNS